MSDVRAKMLEVIAEKVADVGRTGSLFEQYSVGVETLSRLGFENGQASTELQREVLDVWHDLYRSGLISWGNNLGQMNMLPPTAHLTAHGRQSLEEWTRDPSNPSGYLNAVRRVIEADGVAWSYVAEAVAAFNAGCPRATVVLVGAASESLALDLRDALVARMAELEKAKVNKLADWRVKTVLDAMNAEFERASGTMKNDLKERYSSHWSALTGEIRRTRNEAGHPTSVTPVTRETAHASLLIFPEVGRLAKDLLRWIGTAYA